MKLLSKLLSIYYDFPGFKPKNAWQLSVLIIALFSLPVVICSLIAWITNRI